MANACRFFDYQEKKHSYRMNGDILISKYSED